MNFRVRFTPRRGCVTAVLVLGLFFASSARASANLTVDREQFKKQVGDLMEQTILDGIQKAKDTGEEYKKKWMRDVQFGIAKKIAGRIRNNPEAMKMIRDARARGESARKAFHEALRKYGLEDDFKAALSDFEEGKSKEIYDKLKGKMQSAKKRIENLTKIQQDLEDAQDLKEYKKILDKYGIKGKWVENFGKMEERVKKLKGKFDKNFGTHVSIFKTLYEGMEGKELGSEMTAVFSIMEEFGGKVPFIGDFIEAYGQLGSEMLKATLRLKKAFAKWDMGCVGDGTHDWLSKKSNPKNNSFISDYKFNTLACPDGDIPNLYVDWQKKDKLFFWTGERWLETKPGSGGGADTLRDILDMLELAGAKLDGVDASVPAAFKYYNLPGGFRAIRRESETLPKKIRGYASDLESDFVAFGGPKTVILNYMKTKAGYEPRAFFDRVVLNPEIFSYLYIRGFARGGTGAYKKYNALLETLSRIHLRVIWGNVTAPGTVKKIHLSLTDTTGVEVLYHSKEVKGGEYVIFVDAPDSASMEYQAEAEGFPPEKISISSFNFKKKRKDIEFTREITVTFEGPAQALAGEPVKVSAKVSGGEGPYTLAWTTSTNHSEPGRDEDESLNWEFAFPETGEQWIELDVTDKNGVTGQARIPVVVYFTVNLEPGKELEEGGHLRVIGEISGGKKPFKIEWKASDGQERAKDTERTTVWNVFKTPPEGLKWVELAVTDANDVKVPARVDLIMDAALTVELTPSKRQLQPNEPVDIRVKIAGGQAPYTISLETSDGKSRTLRPTKKTSMSFKKMFPGEGAHWLQLTVADDSKEPAAQTARVEFQVGRTGGPPKAKPQAKKKLPKKPGKFEMAPPIPSAGIDANDLSMCFTPGSGKSYLCDYRSKTKDGSGPPFSGHAVYEYADYPKNTRPEEVRVFSGGKVTDIYRIGSFRTGDDQPKCCMVVSHKKWLNKDEILSRKFSTSTRKLEKKTHMNYRRKLKVETFYGTNGLKYKEKTTKDGKKAFQYWGVDGKLLIRVQAPPVEPPKTACSAAMASGVRVDKEKLDRCSQGIDMRWCFCGGDYCNSSKNREKILKPFTGWGAVQPKGGQVIRETAYAEGEECFHRWYDTKGNVKNESYTNEKRIRR